MFSALLPLGLAFLMFAVGMRLTFSGMADIFRRPAALLAGLAVQVFLLPAVAAALAALLALTPAMAAGLIIIAVSPGGITSNYIALLARADIALSTSMTLVTSLAATITIPVALWLTGHAPAAGHGGATFALTRLALAMTAVSLAPLLAGIAMRHSLPRLAAALDVPADRLSRVVFLIIVLATFVENRAALAESFGAVGLACLALNLAGHVLGYTVGRAGGFGSERAVAISIEAGLQNAAVAIFVAGSIFADPALAVPALIYAVIMNMSAIAFIVLRRRMVGNPT